MRFERMTISLVRVMPIIFCKSRRTARTRNLPQALLGEGVARRLGRDAEITRE